MTDITEARDIYHATRRAMTHYKLSNSGKKWVLRDFTNKDAKRHLGAVKVKRGRGIIKDACAKAIIAARRAENNAPVSIKTRLSRFIVEKYEPEILRRGGEISIVEKNGEVGLHVADRNIPEGLVLLKADGWRHYSNRFGARPATIAYLCGVDDNGKFAVRVSGTCKTVRDAVDFLEPAEVKKARESQRRVLRQGDVYVVEMKRDSARQSDLPPRHVWDEGTRTLRHEDGHGALNVNFPAKFVTQSAYRMGRIATVSRGRGD